MTSIATVHGAIATGDRGADGCIRPALRAACTVQIGRLREATESARHVRAYLCEWVTLSGCCIHFAWRPSRCRWAKTTGVHWEWGQTSEAIRFAFLCWRWILYAVAARIWRSPCSKGPRYAARRMDGRWDYEQRGCSPSLGRIRSSPAGPVGHSPTDASLRICHL